MTSSSEGGILISSKNGDNKKTHPFLQSLNWHYYPGTIPFVVLFFALPAAWRVVGQYN
jgi:hypothetical protein